MSLQLSANAGRVLYDDSYKAAYASAGPNLRPYVTFRSVSGTESYNFRTMGRGEAQSRGQMQSQLNVMGISHAKVSCSMSDYYASELTDVFAQDYTNAPQEIPALAKLIAQAVKRKETQTVIDACESARSGGLPTGHAITESGSVGLTVAKLLTIRKLLKANDISELPTILIGETQEYDLLAASDNKFTSGDFSAAAGATTGNIRQGHFGFNYVIIGTGRDESGLPLVDTDDRVCFAFVPSAVGLVVGLEKSEVNYESNVASWRSTGMIRCGSVVIDEYGLCSVECDE